MVQKSSVAVIVMSAADELKSGFKQARPNVVHEIGIAHGILGPEHTIIVKEDTAEEFSNIAGITQIRYRTGEIHTVEEEVLAGIEYRLKNVNQHMHARYYGHHGR